MNQQWLKLFSIIFAGEIIFSLPFHLTRFFRPTFLSTFDLTNTQLGDVFAFYGVVAMLSYFPGGYLADRYSSRHLMTIALIATALGGFYLASFPTQTGLTALFAFWGLTTILFFWSAMIKLTRDIASNDNQGKAFAVLDGGRGLVAAAMATIAVALLTSQFPTDLNLVTQAERLTAMKLIINFYISLTLLAALILWLFIPEQKETIEEQSSKQGFIDSISSINHRVIAYQASIVFCAYCGFKGLDYFGLYLVKVFNYNEVDSSELIALTSYIRPFAAILAGVLADRYKPSKVLTLTFLLTIVCYLGFLLFHSITVMNLVLGNILFCFVLVFALRAIYFALIEQSGIARNMTGLSVGFISVIGFTPDIFFAPIAGRLLDHPDPSAGFSLFFILLIVLAFIGASSAYLLGRSIKT